MTKPHLAKLRIDRGAAPEGKTRRRRYRGWLMLAVVFAAGAGAWWWFGIAAPLTVETATVSTAYPSQSYTLLNATGYVVAQRKAAVASKATGRVEWLGVTEGSRVKAGEVIARLENADVSATMEQASANVRVAAANLQQAQA